MQWRKTMIIKFSFEKFSGAVSKLTQTNNSDCFELHNIYDKFYSVNQVLEEKKLRPTVRCTVPLQLLT